MPDKATVLGIGDIILVSATFDGIERLRKRFKAAQEA